MNKKCKCGGVLERRKQLEIFPFPYGKDIIIWWCPSCKRVVTQRKRTPYKLETNKDIRKIREHIRTLLERNPITDKNRDEWKKFVRAYVKIYTELNQEVEKITTIF